MVKSQEGVNTGTAAEHDVSGTSSASVSQYHGNNICNQTQGSSVTAESPQIPSDSDQLLTSELERLDDWENFDIFKLEQLSRSSPLLRVGVHLFERHAALTRLGLDRDKLAVFLQKLESQYNSVPYHNSVHAADVSQSLSAFLALEKQHLSLTDIEILAVITAAVVHDVGHEGLSNEFLVNSGHELALLYNDRSVNENNHAAIGIATLSSPDAKFVGNLTREQFQQFRQSVIDLVLATDMKYHHQILDQFTAAVEAHGRDFAAWPSEDRLTLLKLMLHCADLSNPAKPVKFSSRWADRIIEEFFSQGDRERELGLPVSPVCDRHTANVARTQYGFLDRVVEPMFHAWGLMCPTSARMVLHSISIVKDHWHSQMSSSH